MNWDNVKAERIQLNSDDYMFIRQYEGRVGKFILEVNIVTGHAELKILHTNEIALSGPIDELINEAIQMYSAHPFGSFAFFLRKCRARALYELYTSPKYSKAVRNFKFQ